MDQSEPGARMYICPMHGEIREVKPGKCPQCGMNLVPEGARFGLLQHLAQNPKMLVAMVVVMIVIMIVVMIYR